MLALAFCLLVTQSAHTAERPNILFIAVDDLRPSIGCYGDATAITPNIDRLATRSVQFNRAYCQVAVCNPSRASLMTGLRPDTLGVWTLPIHFREAMPDAITMPQWFRKHGYTAVSHGKIYHNPTPDPQSWSEPIRRPGSLFFPYPEGTRELTLRARDKLPRNDWRKNNLRHPSTAAPDVEEHELLDGAQTKLAIEDLRRLGKQEQPFFLAVGYIRPHLAWIAPKKYWDLHDPTKLPVVENGKMIPDTPRYAMTNNSELSHYRDLIDFHKPWEAEGVSIPKAMHLVHGYYACVSYVDALIGQLLDTLDEEGLAENTIVVLWSDHGWKLGEYNAWGKMTNYEIDTRVPLLISSPNLKGAGKQSEDLAELLDLYPTLCELTGIPSPDFVEGQSLVPNLNDPSHRVKPAAYSQYYRKLNDQQFMGYALRTDRYRFVEWRDFESGAVQEIELYDHQTDPKETRNIAPAAEQQLLKDLTDQLLSTHPRRELRMTPAVHSNPNPGRHKAPISFSNASSTEVTVIAITPTGRRGKKWILKPGQEVTISARIGGAYVVESDDGKIYQIHSPSIPNRNIVLQ